MKPTKNTINKLIETYKDRFEGEPRIGGRIVLRVDGSDRIIDCDIIEETFEHLIRVMRFWVIDGESIRSIAAFRDVTGWQEAATWEEMNSERGDA